MSSFGENDFAGDDQIFGLFGWINEDPEAEYIRTYMSDQLAREFLDRAWLTGWKRDKEEVILVPPIDQYSGVSYQELISSFKGMARYYGLLLDYVSRDGVGFLLHPRCKV